MAKFESQDFIGTSQLRASRAIDALLDALGPSGDVQLEALSGIKNFLDHFEKGDAYREAPQATRDALRSSRDVLSRIGLDMVVQVWASRNRGSLDKYLAAVGTTGSGVCDSTRGGG